MSHAIRIGGKGYQADARVVDLIDSMHTENERLVALLKRGRRELIGGCHEYNGLCPEPGSRGSRDPDCDACALIVEIERETR